MTFFIKDNWPSVLFAMLGGLVLSIGNLSTQYAWAYVGLSVTEVICASMVVVIGKFVNILIIIFLVIYVSDDTCDACTAHS